MIWFRFSSRSWICFSVSNGFYSFEGQDKWIYEELISSGVLQLAERKVFVEVGGSDGIRGSNTLYFERALNWSGILLEADTARAARCKKNRVWCIQGCVSNISE